MKLAILLLLFLITIYYLCNYFKCSEGFGENDLFRRNIQDYYQLRNWGKLCPNKVIAPSMLTSNNWHFKK